MVDIFGFLSHDSFQRITKYINLKILLVYSIRCNHVAWSNTTGKHFLLATWCNSVLLLFLYFRNNYFSFKGRQIMARRLKRLLLILTLFLKWFINQQLNQDWKRYFEENLQNIWYWKEVGSRREREERERAPDCKLGVGVNFESAAL